MTWSGFSHKLPTLLGRKGGWIHLVQFDQLFHTVGSLPTQSFTDGSGYSVFQTSSSFASCLWENNQSMRDAYRGLKVGGDGSSELWQVLRPLWILQCPLSVLLLPTWLATLAAGITHGLLSLSQVQNIGVPWLGWPHFTCHWFCGLLWV